MYYIYIYIYVCMCIYIYIYIYIYRPAAERGARADPSLLVIPVARMKQQ